MKVQSIQQNINFEAKKRFLTMQQQQDLRSVLEKMNSEVKTEVGNDGKHFAARLIGRMSINNKNIEIIDGRYFLGKVSKEKQMQKGVTELLLDNAKLKIDNKTSEIISYEKSFFTRWNSVMKNVSDSLNTFKENFTNSEVVTKYPFGVFGFTPKGSQALDEIVKKAGADTTVRKFVM